MLMRNLRRRVSPSAPKGRKVAGLLIFENHLNPFEPFETYWWSSFLSFDFLPLLVAVMFPLARRFCRLDVWMDVWMYGCVSKFVKIGTTPTILEVGLSFFQGLLIYPRPKKSWNRILIWVPVIAKMQI